MESRENFVQNFVSRLMEWSQIIPPLQSVATLPRTTDRLIAPLTLTAEDRMQKSDLASIAFATSSVENVNFKLNIAEFIPVLALLPPRKIQEIAASPATFPTSAASTIRTDAEVASATLVNTSKRSKRQHSGIGPVNAFPTISENVKVYEINLASSSTASKKRKPASNASDVYMPSGLSSSSSYQASLTDTSIVDLNPVPTIAPAKLRTILNSFFEHFWDLEIDNPAANGAFFGRISEHNWKDYGLVKYVTHHVNFPVIKDRLDAGGYSNLIEFKRDFDLMFAQVRDSYPEGHAALSKADELEKLFSYRWSKLMESNM